jgi:hypothetical protein
MPHVTLTITADGLALPVMVGLTGKAVADQLSAGHPVSRPVLLSGVIDTATDITVVSARVLNQLGLISVAQSTTRGVGGSHPVDLFLVSLSIPPVGSLTQPLFAVDSLLVMGWSSPPPNIDVLIGLDVLLQLLTVLDGPRKMYTLAD